VQTVTYDIKYNFSDVEQQESKQLWTDYQIKLLPETETVYVAFDGNIIQSPTTAIGQVDSERSISVPRINHHH
jgi:hypothetical protein